MREKQVIPTKENQLDLSELDVPQQKERGGQVKPSAGAIASTRSTHFFLTGFPKISVAQVSFFSQGNLAHLKLLRHFEQPPLRQISQAMQLC